jgi:hypothetical protein
VVVVPPVVLTEGPGEVSNGSQRDETQPDSGSGAAAACRCAADGVSGGVATGRRGCAMHGFPSNRIFHCYILDPALCDAPGVTYSESFQGAAWKQCRSNSD